jgi:hypothetical protein
MVEEVHPEEPGSMQAENDDKDAAGPAQVIPLVAHEASQVTCRCAQQHKDQGEPGDKKEGIGRRALIGTFAVGQFVDRLAGNKGQVGGNKREYAGADEGSDAGQKTGDGGKFA